MPGDDTPLETNYSVQDYLDVDTKNEVRVDQDASGEYAIHQFQDFAETAAAATFEWEGQSSLAPLSSIVVLQIYNQDTTSWENLDTDNETVADTDFPLTGEKADMTNYKDGDNMVFCRVYQLVS